MKTRLAPWSIPVLSLILVLGCTPQQTPAPTDTGTTRSPSPEAKANLSEETFSNEVFAVVSTVGNTFSVSPDPIVVQNRGQKVIWLAKDPDVAIEITFRPDKGKDTPPGVKPPGKPCPAPGRECGGNPIGGNVGKFYYSVTGTKGGEPLDELDPVLEILY